MSETLQVIAVAAGAVITVSTFIVLFWRLFKKIEVLSEGIMGKPAVTDYAGEVVEKPVPSLQARVGKIEELLIGHSETAERLTSLEAWRVEHEKFSDDVVRRLLDIQASSVSGADTIE